MNEADVNPWPRRIFAPEPREIDTTVAAFCGVFGRRWVVNAIANVERQSIEPVQVVMAVNGYDTNILGSLLEFQSTSPHEVWISVNETNLGPTGSYFRNQDLIRGEWTAFLHQDDVYLESHLAVLRTMAVQSAGDTVALFTSMGGISEDGKRRTAPPPMDNAALRGRESWLVVPEIIRRHPFPTPALAVRSNASVPDLAWYDSGAPDSEWFARLACVGTLDATDLVTVLYRQPTDSESSKTDWHTRAWLWSASLNRLIMSPEFYGLLCVIPSPNRRAFAEALLAAIPARYPASGLYRYLQFMAAQRMCDAWAYTEDASLGFISSLLGQWGPSAATQSLEALSGRPTVSESDHTALELIGESPRVSWLEYAGRSAYRRYGHRLPHVVARASLSAYRAVRKGAT